MRLGHIKRLWSELREAKLNSEPYHELVSLIHHESALFRQHEQGDW